jgi:hypothetical protein
LKEKSPVASGAFQLATDGHIKGLSAFRLSRRRHRCNIPHLIVYSVQKHKRGNLFPYRTVDRLSEDPHVCEVQRGR